MNSAADWYAEQEYSERCGMPHEGAAMPKQKISNADRIRQMTDEELVEKIGCACRRCVYYKSKKCVGADKTCAEGNLEWLKKEAKTDDAT